MSAIALSNGTAALPFLLRHEMRLAWRAVATALGGRGGHPNARALFILGSIVAALHIVALPIALGLSRFDPTPTPGLFLIITAALAMGGCLMLSNALDSLTWAVYLRGDLDLLLSSPASARAILTVRALAITAKVVGSFTLIMLPFANMMTLFGRAEWLSIYPMSIALGLMSVGIGLALALVLFSLLGPRHTRKVAQVLAALIGAAFFVGTQVKMVMMTSLGATLGPWLPSLPSADEIPLEALMWWPARAVLGDVDAILGCLAVSAMVFVLGLSLFGARFAGIVAATAGVATRKDAIAKKRLFPFRFRGGLTASIMRKEWRLMIRYPWLISNVFMELLYLLPLVFLFWMGPSGSIDALAPVAPLLVMLAGHLTESLVKITRVGEESPILAMTAPVDPVVVTRAKIMAGVLPVLVLITLPLAALFRHEWEIGLIALVGCALSMTAATCLVQWIITPDSGPNFLRRPHHSMVANLAGLIVKLGLAGATGLAAMGSRWTIVPLVISLVILEAVRRATRARRMAEGV